VAGDPAQLGAAPQEDRHLVAERLDQARFDPLGQLRLSGLVGREDDVAAGAEAGDVVEAELQESPLQLLVPDPAPTDVHPAQEGDVAHRLNPRRAVS
jgi:hypothetical protein